MLNAAVARSLLPYLAAPFLAGLATLAVGFTRTGERSDEVAGPANPLQIGPALQMALTFQLVLFCVAYAREAFGQAGLLASGAVLGLTDVDALTISMSKSALAGTAAADAAQAIAVGVLVNYGAEAGGRARARHAALPPRRGAGAGRDDRAHRGGAGLSLAAAAIPARRAPGPPPGTDRAPAAPLFFQPGRGAWTAPA